jgi:CysZ protein
MCERTSLVLPFNSPETKQQTIMRTFLNELRLGILMYGRAFRFIVKHRLWHYFLYPLLLSIIVFIGAIFFFQSIAMWFKDFLESWLQVGQASSWIGGLLKETVGRALKSAMQWLIQVTFVYVIWRVSKYLILALLTPVLTILSERTEELVTGNKYPFSWKNFMNDMLRAGIIVLRNMTLELLIISLCFVATLFFPILAPISMIFIYIVGYYFYGFSLMDYTNERRRLRISESVQFVRQHKGATIATGGMFAWLFQIPFLGVVFAPIVGVVAATLSVHELSDLGTQRYAVKRIAA